jgi:pyridoxine 4-dehydrogenase
MTTNTLENVARASGTFTFGGDLEVVRLGFGAMRITGPGIWGPPQDRDEALRVLRRTLELGITFIDTADSYGPTISEELIAEALHPYPDELVIATKAGLTRQGPNSWVALGRPAYLRQQCELSLRRLKVDRIDLFQLHRIDPAVPMEDQVGELKDLQDEGKIRHLGLSEVTVDELEAARRIAPIVSVQNRFNLADRDSQALLDHCTSEQIGFIPWRPVADQVDDDALHEVAAAHDATASQIALAWLLRLSPVMVPIPGTSSVAHLEENTAAAAIELTDDDVAALERG